MDRSAAVPFPPPVPHAPATGPRRAGGVHRRRPDGLGGVLRSRRGRGYLAVASVLLLLVVTATVLVTGGQPPETVVRDFYAALAARDAVAARRLVFPAAVYGSDGTLLTDTTLRDPGYAPPVNARVTPLPAPTTYHFREGEEGAEVQVDFELAGPARQSRMILARGGSFGDRWVILNPLARLAITSPVRDGLLIFAGTPYPRSDRELVAFPGAYRVTLAEHPLFEADPVTAFANGGESVSLVPRVRAGVSQEIERQVRAHLDACAGSRDLNPPRCPLIPIMSLTLAQLRAARASRTITRYPTLLVEETGGIDHPLGFRTEMPGEAKVVIRTSPTGAPLINRTETLVVSGTVGLVRGAVVVNPAY